MTSSTSTSSFRLGIAGMAEQTYHLSAVSKVGSGTFEVTRQ